MGAGMLVEQGAAGSRSGAQDLPEPVEPTTMKCLASRSSVRSRAGHARVLEQGPDLDARHRRRGVDAGQVVAVGEQDGIADRGKLRHAALEGQALGILVDRHFAARLYLDQAGFLGAVGRSASARSSPTRAPSRRRPASRSSPARRSARAGPWRPLRSWSDAPARRCNASRRRTRHGRSAPAASRARPGAPWLRACGRRRRTEDLVHGAALRGRVRRTVVPWPGLLSMKMSPPCWRASPRAMGRPRPAPSWVRDRLALHHGRKA